MVQPSLSVEDQDGITVVSFPDGVMLDATNIQKVGQQLYDVVDKNDRKPIVLDFAQVRFMSSQALGMLLTLRRKAEKNAATVLMTGIREKLFRVFQITNLDKMFRFFATNDEAIASLRGDPAK